MSVVVSMVRMTAYQIFWSRGIRVGLRVVAIYIATTWRCFLDREVGVVLIFFISVGGHDEESLAVCNRIFTRCSAPFD